MHFLKAKITTPLKFISCGRFISGGGWMHARRTLDSYELILGLQGTAYIQQEELQYEISPGKALLLFPGFIHQGYKASSDETSFFWVHFKTDETSTIFEETAAFPERLDDSIVIPAFLTIENSERISVLTTQLLHTSRARYYTPYAADYLTTLLLIELSQQVMENTFKPVELENCNTNRFISILEWIRINMHENISVDDLSRRFGYNSDYLTRMFKKRLGLSVIKYINGMRIARAKQQLCLPDKNIKEIAYSLGFKDEKYFMKLFKQSENLTPTEFRNAYYRTHLNNK